MFTYNNFFENISNLVTDVYFKKEKFYKLFYYVFEFKF